MKKKISIILSLLILLTSCSRDVIATIDNSEKVFFYYELTSTGEYLMYSFGLLQYIDLSTGDMTKHVLCAKPNCKHDEDEDYCFAFSPEYTKRYLFLYNGELYYFMSRGDEKRITHNGLYKAETDGTNQRHIFELEEGFHLSRAYFWNGNLIFTCLNQEVNDSGHQARNYRIYVYNFKEVSLFFETGLKYDVSIYPFGIIGNDFYFSYTARDYFVDIPFEEYFEYVRDESSIYWQDLIVENRKMPLIQSDPQNPVYEIIDTGEYSMVLNDSLYYICTDDWKKIYGYNTTTNKTNEIFDSGDSYIYSLNIFDGKIFVATYDIDGDMQSGNYRLAGNYQMHYYDGSKFVQINMDSGKKIDVLFESEEYFFGYDPENMDEFKKMYILKTDYYSGNWDGLIEFEW